MVSWAGRSGAGKAEHGQTGTVSCEESYQPIGFGPVRCNNGSWSRPVGCEPAGCPVIPAPPSKGMVVVTSTRHGATGRYRCRDGYQLVGQSRTTCLFGEWNGETPACNQAENITPHVDI